MSLFKVPIRFPYYTCACVCIHSKERHLRDVYAERAETKRRTCAFIEIFKEFYTRGRFMRYREMKLKTLFILRRILRTDATDDIFQRLILESHAG